MKQITLLSVLALTFFFQKSHSQVTIGAATPPAPGAILDLSPYPTMDKGLGLPRVELNDVNRLMIGGELISKDADSEPVKKEHTGLLVYNIHEDICAEEPLYAAHLYVWDGNKWEGINTEQSKELAPTVKVLVDNRDPNNVETYLTGQFGKKRWMLENLRAKVWDPIRDDSDEKGQPLEQIVGPRITAKGVAAWAYPKTANSITGSDSETNNDTWYRERPDLGLLYNHNAASYYKYEDANRTYYPQEGGGTKKDEEHIQGICPNGWHLPTDKEWTDLEIELIQNTPKYSYLKEPIAKYLGDTDGLNFENDNSQRLYSRLINGVMEHGRGTLHGKVMRGRCESAKGLSKGAIKNGFVLTLAGHVYGASAGKENFYGFNGQAFLWSSSHDSGTSFWGRGLYDGASTFVRHAFQEDFMLSIRCVEN